MIFVGKVPSRLSCNYNKVGINNYMHVATFDQYDEFLDTCKTS